MSARSSRADRSGSRAFRFLPQGVASFLARRFEEAMGLVVLLAGLAYVAMLASYNPNDPSWNTAPAVASADTANVFGVPGAHLADVLLQTLGAAAYIAGLLVMIWGWRVIRHARVNHWPWRLIVMLIAMLLAALALARVPAPQFWQAGVHLGGGLGALLFGWSASAAHGMIGTAAHWAVPMVSGLLALVLTAFASGVPVSAWRRGASRTGHAVTAGASGLGRSGTWLRHQAGAVAGRMRREPRLDEDDEGLRATPPSGRKSSRASPGKTERREPSMDASGSSRTSSATSRREPALDDDEPDRDTVPFDADDAPRRPATVVTPKPRPLSPGKRATAEREPTFPLEDGEDGYVLPPLEILQEPDESHSPGRLSEDALARNAEVLQGVLKDFGVKGEIVKVHPGPVVTLYELEPAPGTKSSRVIGLADDIARSMAAVSVRVAVVPGRSVIGIELPNKEREKVILRELLASRDYEKSSSKLPLILGKDIGGLPVIADLARMPHLLIAGTTGSGKSVAINTMILSLLYRLPPEKCRFIMIDPKMLELSVYEGIPHLLAPVVTDPKKAIVALKWAVREMEDRYRSMAKLGVRNIEGYNARLREAREKGEVLTRKVQTGFDTDTGKPVHEDEPIDLTELPYIVVIVDEMADLMLVAGKDIEAAIQRLAQMARAAGIHMMMATQRPSVDVITGTIKANFPTRVSFAVTSKIDSRTILGEQGAEQLLGQGDMLYMAAGGRLTRVHGPFVTDEEVEAVVGHLKDQGLPDYVESVTEDENDSQFFDIETGGSGNSDSGDELYDQAVALVTRERKASTSFVQRHLQIGYNRAARIIEKMEAEGVVSPANHVGKREVLAGSHHE